MRKQILHPEPAESSSSDPAWLDLETLARVEVTSEDEAHPIESALTPGKGGGWRASSPGEQTLRIVFDEPRRVTRVRLVFEEFSRERFQEFVLRWSPDSGEPREIVRQQYNFSPSGASREVEDYTINLAGVAALELHIVPDKSGNRAFASLAEWRVA